MRENILQSDELITGLTVPPTDARTAYYKIGEKESFDWAIADVAEKISLAGSKALMVPPPKLPIRMSLLNRPKSALAWTIPQGALSEPLEAKRRMKLPC